MTEWPAARPLSKDLPSVPSLASEMLPPLLRSVAEDISERMQVPLDCSGVALVLSLAGAVNRRACIQPKKRDIGWVVIPNLWGGIVAPPGFMKTPVLNEATRPLRNIEERWKHKPSLATTQTNRRLIINDATHQKLHEIMRDNPAGVMAIRDELIGWIAELEAAGREGERAFYLSAWDGNTAHTVDRIGRGTIYVPACCLSLLGGIQPDLLRKLMSERSESNLQDDGLIQRFQLLIWPDFNSNYTYIDRPPNLKAQTSLEKLYAVVTKVDPKQPVHLRFCSSAQQIFVPWFATLEGRIRSGQLDPELAGHLGKYRSLMPSLAALFEIASRGFEGFEGLQGWWEVSEENAQRAINWCAYLEPHARRVYSLQPTLEEQAAVELLRKIQDRVIGASAFFTVRDVTQHGWSYLTTAELVNKATEILASSGWIRPATLPVGPKGGRPSLRFEVNPQAWKAKKP